MSDRNPVILKKKWRNSLSILTYSTLLVFLLVSGAFADQVPASSVTSGNAAMGGNEKYWIKISSQPDVFRGDRLIIRSETNLPVGEHIYLIIRSSTFHSSKAHQLSVPVIEETVEVTTGISGNNQTWISVETSAFKPDEYLIQENSVGRNQISSSLFFNIIQPELQQYWINIHSPGEGVVGEKTTIISSTNLSVGEIVDCEIRSTNWSSVNFEDGYVFTSVDVRKGTDTINMTYCDVDFSTFQPGEYIVTMNAEKKVSWDNQTFFIHAGNPSLATSDNVQLSLTGISQYNDLTYPDPGDPYIAWKANLTFPRTKVSPNMLVLIDADYPVYLHGATREKLITLGVTRHYFILARVAEQKFSGQNGTLPIGDQMLLDIRVSPSYSTHIVDSYITNVTSRTENYHSLRAWVDVKNVDSLASLNEVTFLRGPDIIGNSADDESESDLTPTRIPGQGAVPIQHSPIRVELVILGLLGCGLIFRQPENRG